MTTRVRVMRLADLSWTWWSSWSSDARSADVSARNFFERHRHGVYSFDRYVRRNFFELRFSFWTLVRAGEHIPAASDRRATNSLTPGAGRRSRHDATKTTQQRRHATAMRPVAKLLWILITAVLLHGKVTNVNAGRQVRRQPTGLASHRLFASQTSVLHPPTGSRS